MIKEPNFEISIVKTSNKHLCKHKKSSQKRSLTAFSENFNSFGYIGIRDLLIMFHLSLS